MSAHGKAAVRRADDHAGSESLVDIAVVPEGEGSWVIRMNCGPRGFSRAGGDAGLELDCTSALRPTPPA